MSHGIGLFNFLTVFIAEKRFCCPGKRATLRGESGPKMKMIFPIMVGFLGLAGCGGGSGGSSTSGTVTVSGNVSLPASASLSAKLGHKSVVATGGTLQAFNKFGSLLGTTTVGASGAYSLALTASGLLGNPVFLSYASGSDVLGGITSALHSLDFIPSDATAATINVDPKTDFATGMFLGAGEEQTGISLQIGGDLSGEVDKIYPDAIKKLTESVTGDDDISASTSIDKLDTALEGAYEGHGIFLAQSTSASAVDTLADALQANAGAIATISQVIGQVGGGIPADAGLFSDTKK